jgi:hypothetical protein
MNAKDCRVVRLEIDGSELGEQLSDPGEAHVTACASCAQFRAERASLRALVGSLRPVSAPADFDLRLRARIVRERDSPAQPPWIFRLIMSTPAIALAALVVIVLAGTILWINQRNGAGSSNSASSNLANNGPRAGDGKSIPATVNETNTPAVQDAPIVASENHKRTYNSSRSANKLGPNGPMQSSDSSVRAAQSILLNPDRAGEVSVTAPVNPMVVTVRDEHGGTRRVLLPPVTFGSQRLTGNRVPVSMNNSRDW